MKEALVISSFACYGKCSASIILPVLSSMKISTSILPTVLLSNHTGYDKVCKYDLTDQIPDFLDTIKENGASFQGVYTGYFSNEKQIEVILQKLNSYQGFFFVDPIMGDNGKLYKGLSLDIIDKMKKLCQKATVIVPNVTEACLLTNREYKENFTLEEIDDIMLDLKKIGPQKVILTGIKKDDALMVCFIDEKIDYLLTPLIKGYYHGTGDFFSSLLFGQLMKGENLLSSVEKAMRMVSKAILATPNEKKGLEFEGIIYDNE